jgi:hypothetical protein
VEVSKQIFRAIISPKMWDEDSTKYRDLLPESMEAGNL